MDLVKEWFEYALNDYRVAAYMFDTMHKKPLEIICYHCQQSVEKALKSYLINHDVEPPYIHDLDKLRLMCAEYDSSFETLIEPCKKLTSYITAGRYPSQVEIEEDDAVFALKEAERIYTFCLERHSSAALI
jgi:HEPN domain-containing protein